MVALATAFVALAPQLNKARFVAAGEEAGVAAGAGAGVGLGKGFQKNSQGVFKSMKGTFAGAANILVPLALAGAVKKIYDIGTAYQDNLNIFQVVTKATGAQMDQVAEKARALGADFTLPGVSAAGAATAMTELAKAGFTVQQSMDAAKATLQLARIAGISEGEASTIAANAVNAFGIAAKDTTFVVDELAAAANQSSVDINDVDFAFRMASATFSGFQAPVVGSKEAITELNTAVAILGNNGIRGSDAGTSLKQMLLQLTGPTERAKVVMQELALRAGGANISLQQQSDIIQGSKKVRDKALESIMKSNKGIKDQGDIAYTASGQMRALPEILDLVIRGTKGMSQEQKNAAITQIFGADATRSIIALMKGGLPVYDKMRKAVMLQGAAADFARAKNIGLKGSLDNVRSQMENIAIEIFNQVKGPLTSAFTGLANLLAPLPGHINALGKALRDNKDTLLVMVHVLTAITAAWVTYKLAIFATTKALVIYKGVQEAVAFLQLAAEVRSLADAWALLSAAFAANPIGLVVVAVAALVAGLIYAYKHSEAFRKVVDAVGRALRTAFVATVQYITGTMVPTFIKAYDQVKGATLFLYHNVILPVWNGIKSAISVVVGAVRAVISGLVTAFNAVKGAFAAVGHGIHTAIGAVVTAFNAVKSAVSATISFLHPAFAVITKIFQIWRLVVLLEIYTVAKVIKTVITGAINTFKTVWNAVFAVTKATIVGWWNIVKGIFTLFQHYVIGPVVSAARAFQRGVKLVFDQVAANVRNWYQAHILPIFRAVQVAWRDLAHGISYVYDTVIKPKINQVIGTFRSLGAGIKSVWTNVIKPIFDALADGVRNKLVSAFRNGVKLAVAAWDKIKTGVEIPVKFVVNDVVNPFISGLNKAASIVGVPKKFMVSSIKLPFAEGGLVPGYASGGRIAGAASRTDNRMAPASIPGVGAVKLAGGEFVVNAQDTMKALPLLRWINDGMKGGAAKAGRYLGRPLAQYPGDGSEGFAFAGGGLVGWVKDVWNAISDPVSLIKKPFNALIGQIPGGGMLKEFLLSSGKKLLDGAVNWLTGFGGGTSVPLTGRVGAAAKFLRAQNGKPYVWASAGPNGYDCSGIVSAVYNVLKGKNPYSHTFSTESLPGSFFREGSRTGPLLAGWSHPGQSPASASVGHMAGQLAGLPFESSGSRGVHIGASSTPVGAFAHIGSARLAHGGLFDKKIRLFDQGGYWPSGTLGANLSGRTEYVNPNGAGGDHITIINHGVIGSRDEVDKWFEDAYKRAKKRRRIS